MEFTLRVQFKHRWIGALAVTAVAAGVVSAVPATAIPASHASPANPSSLASVKTASIEVSARDGNTLVRTADGKVVGTGHNRAGQLTGDDEVVRTLRPLPGIPVGVKAVSVAMGFQHTVVVGSNGVAYGSGSNENGQLTGVTTVKHALTPLTGLPAGVRAVKASASFNHTAVLGSNGLVYGAGRNDNGQLTGAGNKSTLTALTGLPGGVKATEISVGDYHVLVVGSNGVVYGAGSNSDGQLTGEDADDKRTLTPLSGLPAGVKALAIGAGFEHSLVLGSNGVAYGAGSNGDGQLTGVALDVRTLSSVRGLPTGTKARGIAAGGYHSLVIATNGRAYGAGANSEGQLTGTVEEHRSLKPLSGLPAGVGAVSAAAGYDHSVVVGSDGVVYGSGGNDYGQTTGADPVGKSTLTTFSGQVVASGVAPRITGAAHVGKWVQVSAGAWAPRPTGLSYRWLRNGVPIAGATGSRYRVTKRDWKKRLSVQLSGTRAGAASGAATSSAVTVLNKAPTYRAKKKPSINGTAKVGSTLRIEKLKKKGWKPRASKHQYQWYRGNVAIKGATKAKYKVKKADRGKRIRVRIIAKKPYYADGTFSTKRTKKVKRR